jgi:alpha 1,2-mannosyltransferase
MERRKVPGPAGASILPWLHIVFWAFGALILIYNFHAMYDPVGWSFGSSLSFSSSSASSASKRGGARKTALLPAAPSPKPARKKVAIIALCRDSDAGEMALSMASFDAAYNHRHLHDFVIFSETEWKEEAKDTLRRATNATVRFPVLNEEDEWATPSWIDREKFQGVLSARQYYGNTESYRRMCRFFAGPVFRTAVLREYEFAWRMDSHVRYLCDLEDGEQDPIRRLEAANATYGYALRMTELMYTVPTLWDTVKAHATAQGLWPAVEREWGIKPDHGMSRACHYWNNFEVTRIDFFRGKEYQALFDHLDKSGGFFYERWGDAPIRTMALILLAKQSEVIQFEEVGYQHPWWYKCPAVCRGRDTCATDPSIQPQQKTDGKMCRVGE